MNYKIYFEDIAPDTGDICQTFIVAYAVNEEYANVIKDALTKADESENRYYLTDINENYV